jgi:hypothetical protein
VAYLEPIMNGLRTALGDGDFSTAWSDGRSLSQHDALDEALSLHFPSAESTSLNAEPRASAHDLA